MDITRNLLMRLAVDATLAITDDERASVAWWESQIKSLSARAPKPYPKPPDADSARPSAPSSVGQLVEA